MKLTMLGLQQALTLKNQTLFDNMNLPAGIDKDTVVDNILLEGSDFEVLYPDPDFMRAAIGTWSNKHYRTFEKWINALNIEYAPLENYDRQEDWTDTLDSDTTNTNVDTTTENTDTTVNTTGEQTDSGSVENTVSAFDADTYQPAEKSDTDNTTNTSTDTSSDVDFTHNSTITDTGTKDDTTVHTGRIHGNVGVTTSQQMLQSELDIARFNIVQQITDLFLTEFCIMIYT